MTDHEDHNSVDVFIGVDVGKGAHHAVALDRSGKRLLDKALPNDEDKLRTLIAELRMHGVLLLVVDQPATIGALPITVARAEGVAVAYLPGLAMRRIADLHAGEAKTDARDAAIIAEAARPPRDPKGATESAAKPSCSARFCPLREWPRLLQNHARYPERSAYVGVKCHKLDEYNVLNHEANVCAAPPGAEYLQNSPGNIRVVTLHSDSIGEPGRAGVGRRGMPQIA